MTELTLTYTTRDLTTSLEDIRAEGNIPAVFYGPKQESTPITISSVDFLKLFEEAGESTPVLLTDGKTEHRALIHDINWDPVKDTPRHADFYIVEKGQKVQVAVPLEFTGVAPAEKTLGGVLMKSVHELEIEATPGNLPQLIEVDISSIVTFEDQILAKDVVLPADVTLVGDGDSMIVQVQAAKDQDLESTDGPDLENIEVEQKGKGEEEGEGEEA